MPNPKPAAAGLDKGKPALEPLVSRIEKLAKRSRHSLRWGVVICGLPAACMLSVIIVAVAEIWQWSIPWLSRIYNGVNAHGWPTWYSCLLLVCAFSLIVGIGLFYILMFRQFNGSYRLARSILYHTDVPALIADEQFMERLAGPGLGRAAGMLSPAPYSGSLEHRLHFAALHLPMLHSISVTGTGTRAKSPGARKWLLDPAGILATRVCFPLGGLASCAMGGVPYGFVGSFLLGVPLSAFAGYYSLSYAEFLGNLTAICDHMLAELAPAQ